MTPRTERSVIERGIETAEARAGSVLSLLGVVSPMVRARTVGPENEDGRIPNTYPLTPLHWRVVRMRRHQLGAGALAEHRDVVPAGTRIRPYAPQDMPNAGYTSVPFESLVQPQDEDDGAVPVVFWPYGDRLLAARIPDRHLTAATNERFEWLSRFGEYGAFGAGRLHSNGTILAVAARAIASMPVSDVVPGIPAY